MTNAEALHETLSRWGRIAVFAAVIGGALCSLAALMDLEQFLRSYLVGFVFWWSVSMGCLGLLMLYYLVGGRWGAAVKPLLECGSLLAPLVALLFLPLALGIGSVYPWVNADAINTQKAMYLNPPFFYARAAVYSLVWSLSAWLLCKPASDKVTEFPERRQLLSAGGLVMLLLSVTFASIDWVMSIDPQWYSSIYGALVAIGGALTAMAFVTLVLAALDCRLPSASRVVAPQTLGDLGSLILTFLMLWAYFAFSQFLIVWSGNLPEENVWYVNRLNGGWQWLGLAIVVGQFVVPFFLLLSRDVKQHPRTLTGVAGLVFVMQFVYLLWTLSPSFHPQRIYVHWADVVAPIAIGGVWVGVFVRLVRRRVPQILGVSAS